MRTVLRWIHLSDIHFRWSDKLDQESGLRQIENDIEKRAKSGWVPDLVFVTGDLANQGGESEYAITNEFFERLQNKIALPRSRFFFCPGNHDVNRNLRPYLFAGCLTRLKDESETDKFLNSPEYEDLIERQAAYWNFVKNFYGKSNEINFDAKKLHYYRNVNIDEMQVSVHALNSSWLSFGGQHDKDRLLIGARNLKKFLDDSSRHAVNLSIALIHHPFEWLAPFEADHIESIACRRFDLILRGHVHRPRLVQINVESGNAMLLTAGAMSECPIRNYEYSYGSLDIPESKVIVHNSIYLTSRNRWSEETRIRNFNRLGSRDHNFAVVEQKIREICGSVSSPCHVSTLLAGIKADMAFEFHNVVGFYSRNLIGSNEASQIDAASGVIKVKALLDFYGDSYADNILADHRDSLLAYDEYLGQNAQRNSNFAEGLMQREKEATSFVNDSINIDSEPPFIIVSLRRSVAEENLKSFKKYLEFAKRLNKSDIGKFARSLEKDLPEKDEDVCLYEVWKKNNGDERFSFKEFSSLIVQLMTKGRLSLAEEVLLRCTKTFPKDSDRYLTDMARNIASEAGNKNIFLKFEQLTKT